MSYKFYGHENSKILKNNSEYKGISTTLELYDLLNDIWCEYSCAPRLRKDWSIENKTVGQCSTTAFLVQDIFGGKVYGIPLEDGSFHCYNVVDGYVFDLTSEQFGDKKLEYKLENEQFREDHFKNEEKYLRYKYLCDELKKKLAK